NQIILFHNVLYRNTLIDQSCHTESIQSRLYDHALILLCRLPDILSHFRMIADNDTAYILLYGAEMVLMPVSKYYQIIFLQKFPQFIRMSGTDDYLSSDKISMRISCNNC